MVDVHRYVTIGFLFEILEPEVVNIVQGLCAVVCGLAFRTFTRHLLLLLDENPPQGVILLTDALEHFGSIVGSVIITYFYKPGLDLGDPWGGKPFFVMSFFFLAAFTAVAVWHINYGPASGPSEQGSLSQGRIEGT